MNEYAQMRDAEIDKLNQLLNEARERWNHFERLNKRKTLALKEIDKIVALFDPKSGFILRVKQAAAEGLRDE